MLREVNKRKRQGATWDSPAWETPGGRIGIIVAVNGNGSYNVRVDGYTYSQVPSLTGKEYGEGQSVRVVMENGLPLITP